MEMCYLLVSLATVVWQASYFADGHLVTQLVCALVLIKIWVPSISHITWFSPEWYLEYYLKNYNNQGPVVQSFVSLTKSLVNDLLSLWVRLTSSVLIFFAAKMWGAFALQKLLTFLLQKMEVFLCIICLKF